MKLVKLTAQNMPEVSSREVYCYEYSSSYIKELAPSLKIKAIIDANNRNSGIHTIANNKYTVYGTDYLLQMFISDKAFIITSDYHNEAYDKLSALLSEKGYTDDIYYYENHETETEMRYREKYRDTALENIIIFRSGPHASSYVKGMDFGDNARALFEHMLSAGLNEKYRLIWFVKNPEEFSKWSRYKNVEFLSYEWSVSPQKSERDRYYHVLCLAKYIFMTDAYGFARNCRSDQIRVQLWHGCGFKTRVNFVRCEKRYEYTTVISDLYSKIHQDIYGLREDQVLVTGYAKQDWLFEPIQDWQKLLNIPKAQKYIFWLPTFRSTNETMSQLNEYKIESDTGLPIIGMMEQMQKLNEILTKNNMALIIKLHPFQKGLLAKIKYSNIIMLENEELVQKDIPINRLLANADALISDYSSAAVDYMLLDRPIAFTLDDADEYENSRGFVFENISEWLPGEKIYTFEDFCGFVNEIHNGTDAAYELRQRLTRKMHKYNDDKNCERIIKALHI